MQTVFGHLKEYIFGNTCTIDIPSEFHYQDFNILKVTVVGDGKHILNRAYM